MRWAVFLDRDGTINEEVEYLGDPERLSLIAGAAEAIRRLNQAGVPAIVVTNQAGVGRGYFSEATVAAIHERMAEHLARHGARVDTIYYCPHHPDDGCDCRKPMAGMLERAARERDLDLGRSFIVGDKLSDLQAGRRVGCQAVLVMTGYGRAMRAAGDASDARPDYTAANLLDATTWILAQHTGRP